MPDFPDLPYRETRLKGHRLFFRRQGNDLWIAGIWKSSA